VGAHSLGTYPGTWRPAHDIIDEEYKEDIFVGYRWADKKKVKPLFPFGYGLSYTTFKLGKLTPVSLDEGKGERSFSIDITNTGSVAGAETVQLYISDLKSSVDRPLKELKAFKKVWLQPGETKTVTLTIDRRALSFWNPQTNEWTVEPGTFEALVGTSAGNITGKVRFSVD
jgi:beta-glucosidase